MLLGRIRADIVQLPKGERGLGDFPKSVVQVQDRKIFPWHEVHGGLSKKLALQNQWCAAHDLEVDNNRIERTRIMGRKQLAVEPLTELLTKAVEDRP